MMMIICTQVTVLKDRYKKMVNNLDNPCINAERKIIINFVENHLEVLELAKKINGLFSILIFLQCSYSSLTICISAYIAFTTEIFSAVFFASVFLILGFIYEIGTICVASNEVTIQVMRKI